MKSRTRKTLVFLAVALLVALAIPAAFVARAVLFPPTFDVLSIALDPRYQRDDLLARGWALPVASTFKPHMQFQTNGSVCGAASLGNVFRSLGERDSSQEAVLQGTGLCRLGICFGGLDLDQLAKVARQKTSRTVTVTRELTLAQFREELSHANDIGRRYVINFHRGLLFGKGTGHHSPIGGYLRDEDLVFVMDVNAKFKPWMVSTERLFLAMDSIDGSSGKKRGLVLLK